MKNRHRNREELKEYNADLQRKFAASKPAGAAPSITYGNSNSGALYTGNCMTSSRSGANENAMHLSVVMGAQISVRAV